MTAHIHQLTLTQQECQVLSVLAEVLDRQGEGYPGIRLITGLSRPVLYVVARRLVARKLARKVGKRQTDVRYVITAAGRKARERYAAELGLRT